MVEFQAGRKAVSGAIRVSGKADAESEDCCKIVLNATKPMAATQRWQRGFQQREGLEKGAEAGRGRRGRGLVLKGAP